MNKEVKKKLKKDWSLLAKPKYRWTCVGDNVKDKLDDYDAIWERAKYCVSSQDVWSLDNYLMRAIYNGLLILKDEQNGHPANLTEEQWDDQLDTAISLAETVLLETFELTEPYFKNYTDNLAMNAPEDVTEKSRQAWLNMEKFYEDGKRHALNELFDWLKVYWWDLWW